MNFHGISGGFAVTTAVGDLLKLVARTIEQWIRLGPPFDRPRFAATENVSKRVRTDTFLAERKRATTTKLVPWFTSLLNRIQRLRNSGVCGSGLGNWRMSCPVKLDGVG